MATAKLTFCLLSLGCNALNVSFGALRNLAFRALSLLYTMKVLVNTNTFFYRWNMCFNVKDYSIN